MSDYHKGPEVTTAPQGMSLEKEVSGIALPDGTRLAYGYAVSDSSGFKGALTSVQHLSAGNETLWARTYLYEDTRFPDAMTGMLDQNGARLSTYSYDDQGRATTTEQAGGFNRQEVTYEGDDTRHVVNPLGLRTNYFYDASMNSGEVGPSTRNVPKRLMSVQGEATANLPQTTVNYDYSFEGLLSGKTDANGNQSLLNNDPANKRPMATMDANHVVTALEWHPTLDLVTRETKPGLTVDYVYDSAGQMLSRTETDTTTQTIPYSTNGQTRSVTFTWGDNGRLLSSNGPRPVNELGQDDITTYTYDAQGNRLTMTDALGHVTSFANYDANGRVGEETDPNGIRKVFTYDGRGNVKTITVKHPSDAALDAVTTFTYDVEGRITVLARPQTAPISFDYDLTGKMIAMRAGDGERVEYTYDAMGNVLSETATRADNSVSRATSRTFDELGRMLSETLGTDHTSRWSYDPNGNPTLVTSPRGNATTQAFDAVNRLVSVVAPDAGTTTAAYDEHNDVTRYTDAVSVRTDFIRDGSRPGDPREVA